MTGTKAAVSVDTLSYFDAVALINSKQCCAGKNKVVYLRGQTVRRPGQGLCGNALIFNLYYGGKAPLDVKPVPAETVDVRSLTITDNQ